MSQGPSQVKASTSRNVSNITPGSRLLQNYPQEPIGTRPSYVGELVAILRDGTPELRGLLETECDLRFNCKVCGSILPSTRSFVIHKRQFCTTKYVEYQRRNVAIMERISNVVSFETKSLQTDDDEMLELDNPINASLLVPLPASLASSAQHNGRPSSSPRANGTSEEKDESVERLAKPAVGRSNAEFIPEGVEVIQPARPPADGVYRFGMGGMSLITNKKKKSRVHASGTVKKKRKQVHMIRDSFSSPKKLAGDSGHKKPLEGLVRPRDGPIMTVSKPPPPKQPIVPVAVVPVVVPKEVVPAVRADVVMTEASPSVPAAVAAAPTSAYKRSRRLGPPINGFDMGKPATPAKPPPVSVSKADPSAGTDAAKTSTSDEAERPRDVKDPAFIRGLLDQMCEVADYQSKKCRDCNRNVVSIYNLDRHVATQHLGLKESEYSLISKELRRLRAEKFGPQKPEPEQPASSTVEERSVSSEDNRPIAAVNGGGETATDQAQDSSTEHDEEEEEEEAVPVPTTSKPPATPSDSSKITERLTAMMRNPDTLKEILTTKEKDPAPVDYELDQLVEIQRQILDAADPYLQCCRVCNKQYFDVYVLNRHIMTVHLRLPERSCGAINKMIKDSMKRYPQAFGSMLPIADSLSD